MSYEEMKDLMRALDNLNVPYTFGNNYKTEYLSDGTSVEYINGHYLKINVELDAWDIDDEDDKWNRG